MNLSKVVILLTLNVFFIILSHLSINFYLEIPNQEIRLATHETSFKIQKDTSPTNDVVLNTIDFVFTSCQSEKDSYDLLNSVYQRSTPPPLNTISLYLRSIVSFDENIFSFNRSRAPPIFS
jgi:hypothetical protein